MQLEEREKLAVTGEMSSIENVLKNALGVSHTDTRDFHTLKIDFTSANSTLSPAQQTILTELEDEFNKRETLKQEYEDIINGVSGHTRANLDLILAGMMTNQNFALFISDAKKEIGYGGGDNRTLQFANHAADIFDEIPPAVRTKFPEIVLKEMIASTESPKRNKSIKPKGGMPVEDIITQLSDDELVEIFDKYSKYLSRDVTIFEKAKRLIPNRVSDPNQKIASVFERYPALLGRVNGITDPLKKDAVLDSVRNINITTLQDERKKEIANALKKVLNI